MPESKASAQSDEGSTQSIQMLKFPAVVRKTGISRTAVYEKIKAGQFPEPVLLGPRAIGFVEREVNDYLAELMSRRQRCA